jgi:hypothetical protein
MMKQAKQIEAELAKTNPRLHALLTRFGKLVEEEQAKLTTGLEELKEQAKVASVKSMMRLRRTQAVNKPQIKAAAEAAANAPLTAAAIADQLRRTSLQDDFLKIDSTATPLKEETLIKQGRDFRIWRSRHFVLRPEGVFYYENHNDFKQHPDKPRGRVLFCDLVCPSGQAADEVPRFMYMMLNRPHVFCLHTEDRTFVISTPSKESLKSWVVAVNTAFNKFMSQQAQKAALMDAAWIVGSPEIWSVVNKLTTNNASLDQVLGELLLLLHEQFEDDVWSLRQLYMKRKAFDAWKARVRYSRSKDPYTKRSDLS